MHTPAKSRSALLRLILVGLVLPTFVTWIYFEALEGSAPILQQTAYAIGKTVQFLLPLLAWRVATQRAGQSPEPLKSSLATQPGYKLSSLLGAASGLVIGAAAIALHFYVLVPSGWMDGPRVAAREKLASMGLDSKPLLLAAAVFYSLVHSGLEEYYWRWFIFKRLSDFVSVPWAVAISSLGFMAHHVIVLARYFGGYSLMTILFALSVAVGGVVWAVLYRRTGTVAGPWISHALVDAAIFVVAWDLAFH